MPSRSREIDTPMLLGCASPYIIGQARIPSARPKSTIPPPTSLSPSHLPGVPEQRLTAPHACVGRRPQSPVHALPLSPPPFLVTAAAGPSPPFPLRRPAPAPAPDQSGPRGRPHLPPRVHSLAVACPAGWPLGPRQLPVSNGALVGRHWRRGAALRVRPPEGAAGGPGARQDPLLLPRRLPHPAPALCHRPLRGDRHFH
jgi:hypothetical protein